MLPPVSLFMVCHALRLECVKSTDSTREMMENNTPRDNSEYVEICKTIKKKARDVTRKHILDEIRKVIESLRA